MFKLVVEKAVILLLLAVVVAVAVAVDEKGRRNNIVEDVAMNLRSDDVQLFIVVAVEQEDFEEDTTVVDDVDAEDVDCAKALIQEHAKTVSKFVDNGMDEMHKNHPVPDKCYA